MNDDPRVQRAREVLQQWVALRLAGHPMDDEEVLRDLLDVVDELQRKVDDYPEIRVEWVLNEPTKCTITRRDGVVVFKGSSFGVSDGRGPSLTPPPKERR